MKKGLTLLLAIIALAVPVWAAQYLVALSGLTGGTAGKLDAIYTGGSSGKYNALQAGDICVVYNPADPKRPDHYRYYVAGSPQSESSPGTIVPDWSSSGVAYSGNGAWLKLDEPDSIILQTEIDSLSELNSIAGVTLMSSAQIAAAYQPLASILTDIADGTIATDLVNTAYPWSDNEVSDTLTIGVSSTVANGALDSDLQIWAGVTPTTEWRTLLAGNMAALRTTAGLVPDTNIQSYDADLASLASNMTSMTLVYAKGNGNGYGAVSPSTGYLRYVNGGYTFDTPSGSSHDAVTLGADADALLGLSTQQLTLDTQTANYVFAGPTSGAAADPTFRALVDADIPDTITVGASGSVNNAALDTDLQDLADGSLTGSKVGDGIDDDYVSFDDADNLWTATKIGPALEELNDSINAGSPNGTGAKVHWSQLLGVPAGFADGSDDGSGGSLDDDLTAIAALSTSGGAAYRTATNTWALRSVATSGDGLDTTDGSGISGNPTIALDVAPSSGSATLEQAEDALQVKYDSTYFSEGASGLTLASLANFRSAIGIGTEDTLTIYGLIVGTGGITPTQSYSTPGTVGLYELAGIGTNKISIVGQNSLASDYTITAPAATGNMVVEGNATGGIILGDTSPDTTGEIGVSGGVLYCYDTVSGNGFVPDTADGGALGSSSLEFSDGYFADGSVLYFGADQDVTLTHVADTGLLLNAAMQLQFRDSAIHIESANDGHLDLTADTSIDLNGAVVLSSTLDVSGGSITLQNDEVIANGTDTEIEFQGTEHLSLDLDTGTSNQVAFKSDTSVDTVSFSALNLVTTGTITGLVPMVTTTAGVTLSAAQCHGAFVMVTSAGTITLPAAATAGYGSTVCVYVRDASETVIIEVDNADKIALNGTALDAGDTIDSAGAAGDFITLISTTDADGSGTDGWRTLGRSGTWTDGGAT